MQKQIQNQIQKRQPLLLKHQQIQKTKEKKPKWLKQLVHLVQSSNSASSSKMEPRETREHYWGHLMYIVMLILSEHSTALSPLTKSKNLWSKTSLLQELLVLILDRAKSLFTTFRNQAISPKVTQRKLTKPNFFKRLTTQRRRKLKDL